MEKSYYFKTKEDVVRYGISPNLIYEDDSQCIPITEEEYNEFMESLSEEAENENNRSAEEYISELEKENASLIYQILTGEELSNA